jgi:23S rRNA pseudouridine2605 synthase
MDSEHAGVEMHRQMGQGSCVTVGRDGRPTPWHYLAGRGKMGRVAVKRQVGLARALSKLGFCSRSQAAKLIRAGRVCLNGAERRDPETPVLLGRDRIEVDRNAVSAASRYYIIVNKPRGVVTTAADEKGRQTVYSLLNEGLPWVGPIGRLDKASEGLLLLTNDSEWAAGISDPGSHLDKTYHVQVAALVGESLTHELVRGVSVRGEVLRAKRAGILRTGEKNSWLEIALDEGKNRQIRRMFEHFGIEVLRLVRVTIGPLTSGQLAKGKSRALTFGEKAALDHALRLSSGEKRILDKESARRTDKKKTMTQKSPVGPSGGSQGSQ